MAKKRIARKKGKVGKKVNFDRKEKMKKRKINT
jgi:hypothetical protein